MWSCLLDKEAKAEKKTSVAPLPRSGMQGNTRSQELGFPFETGLHASQTGPALCISKDSFQLLVLLSLHPLGAGVTGLFHPIQGRQCWELNSGLHVVKGGKHSIG